MTNLIQKLKCFFGWHIPEWLIGTGTTIQGKSFDMYKCKFCKKYYSKEN